MSKVAPPTPQESALWDSFTREKKDSFRMAAYQQCGNDRTSTVALRKYAEEHAVEHFGPGIRVETVRHFLCGSIYRKDKSPAAPRKSGVTAFGIKLPADAMGLLRSKLETINERLLQAKASVEALEHERMQLRNQVKEFLSQMEVEFEAALA